MQPGVIVSKATQQLAVPRNSGTINLFPAAQSLTHLDEERLIVPHGVREMLLLKHLGYMVPNPILYYYDWRGHKPFSVQKATCALLTSSARAYVLNDLGTGKTRSILWAWDFLRTHGYAGKLLVVAPLSTLSFVWKREAFAIMPGRKVQILHGTKEQRRERLNDPEAEIFVINHDGVKVVLEEIQKRTDIDTLALDELAVYRNNSERSKLMRKLAQRFTWVWGMSGEPMPTSPTDVWAQCKIITPESPHVPKFFRHARDMLMNRVNQFKWVPKPNAEETAFRMMQPAVRYSLNDVVELPDVVSRTIDVALTAKQKKLYESLVREYQAMIDQKQITAANAGAAMNKLLQVSAGWVYTSAPDYVAVDAKPRIEALLDLVNDCHRKVLVFVPYRHALAELGKVFREEEIECAIVHGDVGNRDEIFNHFQNTTKYKVLLAHPQCLAHGLTLTAADTIIWYSPTLSLEIYSQANARIRRPGQKHRQQILHLQATPVERKSYALLRSKEKIQDRLLSLFEAATERMPT